MNTQTITDAYEKPVRVWMKKLAWSLPLFFLIKGLLWLALPVLYMMYGPN